MMERESYGEDIAESETQQTDNSEDEYEGSFIDDGDPDMFLPSSISNSEGMSMPTELRLYPFFCEISYSKRCLSKIIFAPTLPSF